jgi:hypothetical protein
MLPCEADQERHHAGPGHPPCHDVTTTITHNTIGNVVGDGASIVMELRLEERLAVAAPRHAWILGNSVRAGAWWPARVKSCFAAQQPLGIEYSRHSKRSLWVKSSVPL